MSTEVIHSQQESSLANGESAQKSSADLPFVDPLAPVVINMCAIRGNTIQRERLTKAALNKIVDEEINLLVQRSLVKAPDMIQIHSEVHADINAEMSIDNDSEILPEDVPSSPLPANASEATIAMRNILTQSCKNIEPDALVFPESSVHTDLSDIDVLSYSHSPLPAHASPTAVAMRNILSGSFNNRSPDLIQNSVIENNSPFTSQITNFVDDSNSKQPVITHTPAKVLDENDKNADNMSSAVSSIVIKLLRKQIAHFKAMSISDAQLIAALKSRIYGDDESTLVSDTDYIKKINKAMDIAMDLDEEDIPLQHLQHVKSVMSLLSEDGPYEDPNIELPGPSRNRNLAVVNENEILELDDSRVVEFEKIEDVATLKAVIKSLRVEMNLFKALLLEDAVVISGLKTTVSLKDDDDINIPGFEGIAASGKNNSVRDYISRLENLQFHEQDEQDSVLSKSIDEVSFLKRNIIILKNLLVQQAGQILSLRVEASSVSCREKEASEASPNAQKNNNEMKGNLAETDELDIQIEDNSLVSLGSIAEIHDADDGIAAFDPSHNKIIDSESPLNITEVTKNEEALVIKSIEGLRNPDDVLDVVVPLEEYSDVFARLVLATLAYHRHQMKTMSAVQLDTRSASLPIKQEINDPIHSLPSYYRDKSNVNYLHQSELVTTHRIVIKIQAIIRGFIARKKVTNTRQLLAARASGVLFAMKPTKQGSALAL